MKSWYIQCECTGRYRLVSRQHSRHVFEKSPRSVETTGSKLSFEHLFRPPDPDWVFFFNLYPRLDLSHELPFILTNTTMSHPIQAVQEAAGAIGADPRLLQRATVFQGLNEGPAATAAKITGVTSASKRQDDAPYHTNNDGIPWPAPDHSKTIGGIPVVSDIFLMQKQQAFNRHKLLERMVHPCKSLHRGGLHTQN
jgi:hypothetical protein